MATQSFLLVFSQVSIHQNRMPKALAMKPATSCSDGPITRGEDPIHTAFAQACVSLDSDGDLADSMTECGAKKLPWSQGQPPEALILLNCFPGDVRTPQLSCQLLLGHVILCGLHQHIYCTAIVKSFSLQISASFTCSNTKLLILARCRKSVLHFVDGHVSGAMWLTCSNVQLLAAKSQCWG